MSVVGGRKGLLTVAVTVVLAAAAVLLVRTRPTPAPGAGDAALPLDPSSVAGLQVTVAGVPYRFQRTEGGAWTLDGAVSDWVDGERMAYQLGVLAEARGGTPIPGSEPEDRRFEFNGPAAVRVTVYPASGEPVRLALGAVNPVTGAVYASGAGRTVCFSVPVALRDRLAGLPDAVRLGTLLPPTEVSSLQEITIRKSRAAEVLARVDGRWWLLAGSLENRQLPAAVRDWQRLYDDRRRRDDRGWWVLADDRAVAALVYEVTELQVGEFVPPDAAGRALVQWGLQPPLIAVELQGQGIDPDPGSEDPDRLVIGFGQPLDEASLPAVRRGVPLLAPLKALDSLQRPVGDLCHVFALTERPLLAAEVELAGPHGPLLRGRRTPRPHRGDARNEWDQLLPEPGRNEVREHLTFRNFIVDLDRLAVRAVLPPTDARRVLLDGERYTVTITQGDGRSEAWECGLLDPDHVPGGPDVLAPVDGVTGPVGLWRPADGRLLQVADTLLLTARSLSR